MFDKYDGFEIYKTDWLNVGGGHEIYFEIAGNPKGIPVVRLHGGPGANSKSKNMAWYNSDEYMIILFDQRGCGKSKPYGEIKNNTTHDLIADMEKLRKHLGVDKWVVTGGSWGSTLGLLYAQAHPGNVLALGVSAVFLAEKEGVDWLYEGGASQFYPERYAEFIKDVPATSSVFEYYTKNVLEGSGDLAKKCAVDFMRYVWPLCDMEENYLVELNSIEQAEAEMTDAKLAESKSSFEVFSLNHARIEMHYEVNSFFIEEGQILQNMHKIRHIPLHILHGRYDMVCPVEGAYRLAQAHGNAFLEIVPTAGHSTKTEDAEQAYLRMYNVDILKKLNKFK